MCKAAQSADVSVNNLGFLQHRGLYSIELTVLLLDGQEHRRLGNRTTSQTLRKITDTRVEDQGGTISVRS
jgi:hypothetical protein